MRAFKLPVPCYRSHLLNIKATARNSGSALVSPFLPVQNAMSKWQITS